MVSKRRRQLAAYFLTVKQQEKESLKAYLAMFNKECMTMNDQDENITLVALLGGIWPRNHFMENLPKRLQRHYDNLWIEHMTSSTPKIPSWPGLPKKFQVRTSRK